MHHSEEGGGPTEMSKTLLFPETTRDLMKDQHQVHRRGGGGQ